MSVQNINENTCILYLGDRICDAVSQKVMEASALIKAEGKPFIIDVIPSYTSVLVHYNLMQVDHLFVHHFLRKIAAKIESDNEFEHPVPNMIELPVYYGDEVALDLDAICKHSQLDKHEVIQLHSQSEYRVYAIGFSPGFAYLGNVDHKLAIPRKATPRLKIPKGSLGIADTQTAIYPSATPGGWQIIGRTPTDLLRWDETTNHSEALSVFNVGDIVKFKEINKEQFLEFGGNLDGL